MLLSSRRHAGYVVKLLNWHCLTGESSYHGMLRRSLSATDYGRELFPFGRTGTRFLSRLLTLICRAIGWNVDSGSDEVCASRVRLMGYQLVSMRTHH